MFSIQLEINALTSLMFMFPRSTFIKISVKNKFLILFIEGSSGPKTLDPSLFFNKLDK